MANYKNCIPDAFHQSIREIPYQDYKKQGITTLFFDLDNTIIDYHETIIDDSTFEFLNALKKDFNILVISNSPKSRVEPAVRGFHFVSFAMKPFAIGFKKALGKINVKPNEVIMVGDQLLTDVQGAKKLGMTAILVKAVARKTDKIWTRYNRRRERYIINQIKVHSPKSYQEVILPYESSY